MRPSTSLGTGEAFDGRLNRAREDGAIEGHRMPSHSSGIERDLGCPSDAGRECVGRLFADEYAGDAVQYGFARATPCERHHGGLTCLRLDRDDAKILFARKQHRSRASILVAHVFVGK
jgi:hypothetical protein